METITSMAQASGDAPSRYAHREHEVGFGSGYVVGEKLLGFAEGGGTSGDRTGLPQYRYVQMDVTPKGDNRFLRRLG